MADEPKTPTITPADGLTGLGALLAFIGAVPLFGVWVALFGLGLAFVALGVWRGINE